MPFAGITRSTTELRCHVWFYLAVSLSQESSKDGHLDAYWRNLEAGEEFGVMRDWVFIRLHDSSHRGKVAGEHSCRMDLFENAVTAPGVR